MYITDIQSPTCTNSDCKVFNFYAYMHMISPTLNDRTVMMCMYVVAFIVCKSGITQSFKTVRNGDGPTLNHIPDENQQVIEYYNAVI